MTKKIQVPVNELAAKGNRFAAAWHRAHAGYLTRVFACAGALSLLAGPAQAWEPDVHFGLTKWLALKVGYEEKQAGWIAKGSLDVDDSYVTGPVIGTTLSSCIGSEDAAGSASVQGDHFPGKVAPPNAPASRSVIPGDIWIAGMERKLPPLNTSEASYQQLGRYLHAFQDSWSHRGVPDVPPFCSPSYGWGHSIKRGGWSCHLADLTYKWVDGANGNPMGDSMAMAEATYDVLSTSLKSLGKDPTYKWSELQSDVRNFMALATKDQKDKWFRQERFTDPRAFLMATSLPDCEAGAKNCSSYAFAELIPPWNQRVRKTPQALPKNVPAEIWEGFKKFFKASVDGAGATVKQTIDQGLAQIALQRALHVNDSCPALHETLFDSALGKGFLLGWGAQQPLQVCELAAKIQSDREAGVSCADATREARASLQSARPRSPPLPELLRRFPEVQPFVFTVRQGNDSGEYWAFAHFPHLPRDQLAVSAKRIEGKFKVTGFIWQPSE